MIFPKNAVNLRWLPASALRAIAGASQDLHDEAVRRGDTKLVFGTKSNLAVVEYELRTRRSDPSVRRKLRVCFEGCAEEEAAES